MNKDSADPGLIERNQAQSLAESQSTSIAPILKANVASISKTDSKEAQVREIAFHLYEERGCRDGHDLEDWLDAEAIISSHSKQAA